MTYTDGTRAMNGETYVDTEVEWLIEVQTEAEATIEAPVVVTDEELWGVPWDSEPEPHADDPDEEAALPHGGDTQ